MRTFTKLGALVLATMALATVACGGGAEEAGDGSPTSEAASALVFQAEASPLADFKHDTGLIPEGSPAQVQLALSAGGGVKVEAAAEKGSEGLTGTSGGGKLAIDLHMKLDGRLKVDSTFKSYDGEIPGLKDIDIPILGSVPFDGLLLDAADGAEASADLPETTLPEIPLGSIPGSLVLTVAKGSKLTTKFHATCLSIAKGKAMYSGESKTGGSLVLKGKIVLKLPAPLNKSVDLPEITVPIPEVTTAMDAAPLAVSDVDDATQGACGAAASNGGNGGNGGSSADDNGGSSSDEPGGNGDHGGNGGDGPRDDNGTGTGTGADGGAPDGGADSGTSNPPVCADPNDPGGTEFSGKYFRTADSVDTATTVKGILNGAADVDYYRGYVDDEAFALLQPNIVNATNGAELCVFVKCLGTGATTLSCDAGSLATNESGTKGCCVGAAGAVKPKWNCSGLDETAAVSFRVKNKANACLPYSFSYVF